MSISRIFGVASTALNAQAVRMNLATSNLANAGNTASTEAEAFKAKRPVFQALMEQQQTNAGAQYVGGVKIDKIVEDQSTIQRSFEPSNPAAGKDGFIYKSNVNEMSETVEMMAAARSYQNNVDVVNTARELMLKTIDMIKG